MLVPKANESSPLVFKSQMLLLIKQDESTRLPTFTVRCQLTSTCHLIHAFIYRHQLKGCSTVHAKFTVISICSDLHPGSSRLKSLRSSAASPRQRQASSRKFSAHERIGLSGGTASTTPTWQCTRPSNAASKAGSIYLEHRSTHHDA